MAHKRSVDDFIPLKNELLVTVPEEHQKKTKSGIIIPDGVDLGIQGEMNVIVAKGPRADDVEIGDEVVIRSGTMDVMQFKEGPYALVRENQLGGVFRKGEKPSEEKEKEIING